MRARVQCRNGEKRPVEIVVVILICDVPSGLYNQPHLFVEAPDHPAPAFSASVTELRFTTPFRLAIRITESVLSWPKLLRKVSEVGCKVLFHADHPSIPVTLTRDRLLLDVRSPKPCLTDSMSS